MDRCGTAALNAQEMMVMHKENSVERPFNATCNLHLIFGKKSTLLILNANQRR